MLVNEQNNDFFALNNGEKILEKTSTNFSKTILFGFVAKSTYLCPGKVPLLPAA